MPALLFPIPNQSSILIPIQQAAGGLISACLLSVPGASAIYKGGLTVRITTQATVYIQILCILRPRPSGLHSRVPPRIRRLDTGKYREL